MMSTARLFQYFAVVLLLTALPGSLPAQQQPPRRPAQPPAPRRSIYVEVDIETNQGLDLAQSLIAKGEYDRAIKIYERIRANPGVRAFLRKEGENTYLGVRRYIRRALLSLPEKARQHYLMRADPKARRDYKHALSRMEEPLFEEVARAHSCSSWGDDALAMVARYLFERGDYAGCAAIVEQLLARPALTDVRLAPLVARLSACYRQLGDSGAFKRLIASLPEGVAGERMTAGTESCTLAEFLKAVLPKIKLQRADPDWNWCTQGGDNTRAKPLPDIKVTDTVLWRASLGSVRSAAGAESDIVLWNNHLFVQSMSLLFCVDVGTGKLAWVTRLCPPEDYLSFAGKPARLALRDGCLYVLQKPNRIAAVDALTGHILWRSTAAGEDQAFMAQAELYGPILATGHGVCVCAVRGMRTPETYVCCFDPRDGKLKWITFIAARAQSAAPSRRIPGWPPYGLRETAPASLAESANTVFCLTNGGAIAAISGESGEILWLRTYPAGKANPPAPPAPRPPRPQPPPAPENYPKGSTRCLLVAGRTLIAAPADSGRLMALNPSDGSVIWQREREIPDRILCACSQILFGVRGSDACAISAQTGKEVWLSALPHADWGARVLACPSGSFLYFYCGDTVLRLSAADGTRDAQLKTEGAKGTPVLCEKGMIITSGASAVLLLKEGVRLPEPETEVSESSDVAALIRALGDPCYPVRRAAYELLRGKEAKIVAQLDAAAKSADAEVAWRAAQLAADKRRLIRIAAFRQIAPPIIKENLPHYLVRATEPDYRIRLQFLREACALGNSEAILRQIAPFIKEFLKDESWAVRLEAALGLLKCGDSSGDREIESALASDELAVRRNTVTILAQYPSVAAELLIRALDDKDYQVRLAAVNGLAKGGASTALTKLGKLLKEGELDIKLACVRALVSCGKELSVPLLSPALTDKAREVRVAAVEALANMDRQQAIKALIPALADTDEAIFDFVAEVIYEYADSSFDKAVPLLARLLKAERRKTRSYAQQLLGEIGTHGAANALVECLTDPDTDLSNWAADYLLNEADASAVPSLAAKLSHKNTRVRYFAVQILAHIGASECVRPLLKMTGDKDERIASTSFRALRLTVETAHIPEILKLHIHDKKRAVRLAMDSLLGKLTKRVLIPGLIDTLQSSGRDIQLSALRMLKEKSGKDFGFHPDRDEKTRRRAINRWREWWVNESVPEKQLKKLLADLKKGVPSERWRAAERLAGIKSGTVIGALVEALDEELAWVLKAKIEALQKLTGKSFGYKKSLAPDKVKSVIGKWRNWWSKARKDY